MDKAAVALSGGVDSAAALFLLKEQGFSPVAVFTDYFDCSSKGRDNSCCASGGLDRARETADYLGVPFYRLDFKDDFSRRVAAFFAESYARGVTPNPCILCNSLLRFSLLPSRLKAMGISLMATGHYASLEGTRLFRGADRDKDQSYFLYAVERKNFENVIFPLAGMTKSEVRLLARREGLPPREEAESQDSCILSDKSLKEYLAEKITMSQGEITDRAGNVLGVHDGCQNYTVGQGLRIGGLKNRLYVSEIIPGSNRVIAAEKQDIYRRDVSFRFEPGVFFAAEGMKLEAKLRSTHPPAQCVIIKIDPARRVCLLRFDEPVWAPAPGQSAVLYRDDEVIGGGEILPGG